MLSRFFTFIHWTIVTCHRNSCPRVEATRLPKCGHDHSHPAARRSLYGLYGLPGNCQFHMTQKAKACSLRTRRRCTHNFCRMYWKTDETKCSLYHVFWFTITYQRILLNRSGSDARICTVEVVELHLAWPLWVAYPHSYMYIRLFTRK